MCNDTAKNYYGGIETEEEITKEEKNRGKPYGDENNLTGEKKNKG